MKSSWFVCVPRLWVLGFAAGLMALVSSSAQATVAWSDPAGSNSAFTWSGGLNNTDLFGSPTIHDWGFAFNNPNSFRVEGGAGVGASATDFAKVTVAEPAGTMTQIRVEEWGTWSSDISSESDFLVQADVTLQHFAPNGNIQHDIDNELLVFENDGTWRASGTLTYTGPPGTMFLPFGWIHVTNTIQVLGAAPADSFIEKEGMRIIIPEPATIVMLLIGCGPAVLRRPRRG